VFLEREGDESIKSIYSGSSTLFFERVFKIVFSSVSFQRREFLDCPGKTVKLAVQRQSLEAAV